MNAIDAMDVADYNEDRQLEALFRRCPTMDITALVNQGGTPVRTISPPRPFTTTATGRAFSPKVTFSTPCRRRCSPAFEKEFHVQGGKYTGITSDTDDRIHARNSLETVDVGHAAAR